MTCEEKCPVCGTLNVRTTLCCSLGLVEDKYFCRHCGFLVWADYSRPLRGICPPEEKKEEILTQYKEKIAELKLEVIPSEACP